LKLLLFFWKNFFYWNLCWGISFILGNRRNVCRIFHIRRLRWRTDRFYRSVWFVFRYSFVERSFLAFRVNARFYEVFNELIDRSLMSSKYSLILVLIFELNVFLDFFSVQIFKLFNAADISRRIV
jgi:hypothetical protein